MDLAAATDGSREFVDDETGLATGGAASHSYDVAGGTPFKVTLAWSDYPGNTSATKMLVNDLDLEVSGPGGAFYRGNVFAGGWSVAGGLADSTNNVENVYVQSPAAGLWTVTVRGFNVPQGPQPYALVVGGLVTPGPPVEHELTVTPPTNGTLTSADGFIACGTGGAACSHLYAGGILRHSERHARHGIRARGLDGRLRRSRRDVPPRDEPAACRRRELRAEPRLAFHRRRQRRRRHARNEQRGADRVAVRGHERAGDRRLRHGRRDGCSRQRLRRARAAA